MLKQEKQRDNCDQESQDVPEMHVITIPLKTVPDNASKVLGLDEQEGL